MKKQHKAPLSPERVVRAARELIDQEGLDAFSTRKLGAVLGVEAMALYHHFPSKGRLLDAVADQILSEVVLPELSREDPVAWLRDAVYRYRAVARAHPPAFPLIAAQRFNTPPAHDFLEGLLACLQGAGLSPVRAARHVRVLGYFLNGALLFELTVLGQRPDPTDATVEADFPSAYPAIAQSAPYLGSAYLDATFHEGLEALLTRLGEEIGESL